MKNRGNERGFVMKLTLVVVAVCALFLVLGYLARSLSGPLGGNGGFTNSLAPQGGYTSIEVRTNPLLDFGGTNANYGSYSSGRATTGGAKGASKYSGQISLSTGNVYTAQPGDEYLTLRNSGAAVDITGWILTNSKGTRPIENAQNSYYYPTADSAVIGQGTEFLDPSGRYVTGDIVLKSGEMAYITTGKTFAQFPFPISTSFRENICEGYLKNYPFEPQLQRSCPAPTSESQVSSVTDECYDYMNNLPYCTDPSKYTSKYEKERYDLLTSQCKNFMLVRLNYPSCVANHRNDKGFSMGQWRVFLGKERELWANQRETITLYDKNGLVVDQVSY